jgi:hypothetical protein
VIPPIHETVARRWRLVRLASQAAAGAAVASAVALLLGAAPWLHLAAILAGGAVAAAWPVRRDDRRALRWVADHAGLAYETAWDHARGIPSTAPAATDPAVALRAAVAVQARLSIRDLRPPPVSAWWLPLATLAFGMWAWSLLGPGGGVGAPGTPTPGPTPPAPTAPAPTPPEPLVPEEAEEDVPLSPDDADAPGSEPGADAGGDAAAGEAGAGGEGSPSERDALERFLENLRERPELSEEERLAAEARLAAEPVDGDAEAGDPAAEAEMRPGDPRRDDGRDDADDGEEGPGEEAGEGEDGMEGAGDERPGEGEEGEEGEAGTAGEEEAGRLGEEGGDQEGAAGEEGPDGAEEGGDEGQAGIGIGAEGDAGPEADATGEDLEALPSILGPGPEQAIGGVQLPGVAPDGEVFPTGPAGSGYRRAVEQALSEGEVPVPYQEVIRNYFR